MYAYKRPFCLQDQGTSMSTLRSYQTIFKNEIFKTAGSHCAKDKIEKHVGIKAYPTIKLERSWTIAILLLLTTICVCVSCLPFSLASVYSIHSWTSLLKVQQFSEPTELGSKPMRTKLLPHLIRQKKLKISSHDSLNSWIKLWNLQAWALI